MEFRKNRRQYLYLTATLISCGLHIYCMWNNQWCWAILFYIIYFASVWKYLDWRKILVMIVEEGELDELEKSRTTI